MKENYTNILYGAGSLEHKDKHEDVGKPRLYAFIEHVYRTRLHFGFCILPFAFCILPFAFWILPFENCATAQDTHFSQFTSATMKLNPAAIGMMTEAGRFNLQYRNQWASLLGSGNSYKTIAATFERRKDFKSTDFFGFGVGVWSDRAGAALRTDEITGGFSYARKFFGKEDAAHYLTGGAEVGERRVSLDLSDREWISQHDGNGGFDPSKYGGTVAFSPNYATDISMGLGWYSNFGKNKIIMAGFALHHLNNPTYTVDNARFQTLQTRRTAHLAVEYPIRRNVTLLPSVLWMTQGPATELTYGAKLKFIIIEPNSAFVQVGAFIRKVNSLETGSLSDAIIFFGRLDWKNYGLGASYDINGTTLRDINPNFETVELTLSYRFGEVYDRPHVVTPRFF